MKITVLDSLGISVFGMCVVFMVLCILMAIIYTMSAITKSKRGHVPASAAEEQPKPSFTHPIPARGSCGEVDLFEVPDRAAAVIMAIVADELGAPLSELRFTSIREVEEGENEV